MAHDHGIIARLQRAWPDAVITGGAAAEGRALACVPGALARDVGPTASYCGLVICCCADAPAPSPAAGASSLQPGGQSERAPAALGAVALTVVGAIGIDMPYFNVELDLQYSQCATEWDGGHPALGCELQRHCLRCSFTALRRHALRHSALPCETCLPCAALLNACCSNKAEDVPRVGRRCRPWRCAPHAPQPGATPSAGRHDGLLPDGSRPPAGAASGLCAVQRQECCQWITVSFPTGWLQVLATCWST